MNYGGHNTERRALLDTNILISGIAYQIGNEHEILQLAEQREFILVLPETVILETRKVLARKFEGFEELFELIISRIKPEIVPFSQIMKLFHGREKEVRDSTDLPVYIATLHSRPDFAVTGDQKLRDDLNRSIEIKRYTRICTSREFLKAIRRP